MIILDINNEETFKQLKGIGTKHSFEWQCSFCGEIHQEKEYRNFLRRKIKCNCQERFRQIKSYNEKLLKVNYEFLYQEPNAYELTNKNKINREKKILVKCLACGKVSYEYYDNLIYSHKICNCNEKQYKNYIMLKNLLEIFQQKIF